MKKCIYLILLIPFLVFEATQAQDKCLNEVAPIIEIDTVTVTPFPPSPPEPTGPTPNTHSPRKIAWVHGLAGNADAFGQASVAVHQGIGEIGDPDYFPARKALRYTPSYSESVSIIDAALDLEAALEGPFEMGIPPHEPLAEGKQDPSFIISVSQGGIVSRMMDKIIYERNFEHRRKYGGIVTFDTPHGGAQVLNNVDELIEISQISCEVLLPAFTIEKLRGRLPPLVESLFAVDIANLAASVTCDMGPLTAAQQFLVNTLTPNTTNDFLVGAPALEDLNSFSHPNINKVAFVSTKDPNDSFMWRTLNYISLEDVNDKGAFGANNDDALLREANAFLQDIEEELVYQEFLLENHSIWDCIFSFFSDCNPSEYEGAIEILKRAERWMHNIDDYYKVAIGALAFEPDDSQQICFCQDTDGEFHFSHVISPDNPEPCNPADGCEVRSGVSYTVTRVEKPSDGIVLLESQQAFNGAREYELFNNSHFQVRNSSQTRDALLQLLDGHINEYFLTDIIEEYEKGKDNLFGSFINSNCM